MTESRGRMELQQCPLTCGLPTRMTADGFSRACAARLERIKKLAEVSSTDPHAAWCRKCLGKMRPAELEIVTKEEMIMETTPRVVTGEQEYNMPPNLAKVLRPMSQSEAEKVTLKDLMKFWRRPLIKIGRVSECPCCGKVRALKCRGLCGGCNSTKVAKHNLTGHALLDHLAMRAAGDNKINTVTTTKKSTIPASEPSSPAAPPAEAGKVESFEQKLDSLEGIAISVAIRKSLGVDAKTPLRDLPTYIDHLIEERDLLETEMAAVADVLLVPASENLVKVAGSRMAEAGEAAQAKAKVAELGEEVAALNRMLATQPIEKQPSIEQEVVAKWSAVPTPDGYEALTSVLQEAIDQAAIGKGRDRHADGKPFHEQPILRESQAVGFGFPAGQARKKILEAVRCCQDHPERAIADLLGAINYTAALVIAIRSNGLEQGA